MKFIFGTPVVLALGNTIAVLGATTSTTSSPSSTITAAPFSNKTSSTGTGIYTDTSCFVGGVNALYSGYSTNPGEQCYCISRFSSWYDTTDPATRTYSRTIGMGITSTTITTGGSTFVSSYANLTTFINTAVGNQPGADGFNWYGTAIPPCCSSCTIAAATVEMFYFPTPAVSGAATSFVSNGYTFISPSVYVGFTSLYAYDFCGNVGNVFTSTTIEFNPTEIMTFGIPTTATTTLTETYYLNTASDITTETTSWTQLVAGPASAINFRDLNQNCSTISGYTFIASEPYNDWAATTDPCHPTIILPAKIKSLDPAWATCLNNPLGGFYDPPYALTQAAPLGVVTSTTTTSPQPSPTATIAPSTTAEPASTTLIPAQSETQPTSTTSADPQPTTTSASAVVDPQSTASALPVESTTVADPGSPGQGGSSSTTTSPAPVVSSQTSPETSPGSQPASQDPGISVQGSLAPTTTTIPQAPVVSSQASSVALQGSLPASQDPGTGTGSGTTSPIISVVVGPSSSIAAIVVGSQTVQPGSAITQSGTTISLATSGGIVVVNGQSTTIPNSAQPTIIGSHTVQPGSTPIISAVVVGPSSSTEAIVVGSQTVQPGSAITRSGTTISLAASGGIVVVNGQSTTIPNSAQPTIIGSHTVQPGSTPIISAVVVGPSSSTEAIVIGSKTIKPGSAVTLSGTTFSLASTGGSVFINGAITTLPSSSTAEVFVIGSQSVRPGSAITVSGTTYSLAATGGSVIVNGVSTSPAIGSIIMSLISPQTLQTASATVGAKSGSATTSGPVQVTGNVGSRLSHGLEGSVAVAMGIIGIALVL